MITLSEFLRQCDEASWLLTVRIGNDPAGVVASGSCVKPHCGQERITLARISLPQGLPGNIKEQGRKAGKLVSSTLIEDEAEFAFGDATLTVWRLMKHNDKED